MGLTAVAPRPSVERRSGTLDVTDRYAVRMVRMRDQLLRQGMQELQNYTEFQDAAKYIDYLTGNFWDPNRPAYKSKFYDAYLADQRREALSALSDIRPTMDITCKVDAYQKQGKIAHNYIRYLWDDADLDLKVVSWVDHALFGTGFLKSTAYFPGEFQFSTHGLDYTIPVGMDDDLQEAGAVIYRAYKPIPYFISRFGAEKCVGLERESTSLARALGAGNDRYTRPDSIPEYTWKAMAPQLKRRMAMRNGPSREAATSEYAAIPVVELMEIYLDDWTMNEAGHEVLVKHPDLDIRDHNYHYLVGPGRRVFPRKRLIVFAGDRVMYDGPSPFWHGEYPFTMLQLNPCVWNPGGISKYRDLIPLVRSINRIGVGIDEAVMRALNGTWVSKRGAMPEAVWDAFQPGKPGQKMLLNPTGNPQTDVVEKSAPALPQQVNDWLRYLVETIKKRSGSLDPGQLARKKQVPSGEAQDSMRDTMSAPFRLESRYVESAIKRAAKQAVSNVFQFCSLSQRLRVLGGDGHSWEDFDYNAGEMTPASSPREDHWKLFSVRVAQGSMHGSSKMQKKQEAMAMHQRGALSTEGLYEQAEVAANWETEKARMLKEHEAGIGVGAQKAGRTPRPTRSSRNGQPM